MGILIGRNADDKIATNEESDFIVMLINFKSYDFHIYGLLTTINLCTQIEQT